jgi:hypothetical protein
LAGAEIRDGDEGVEDVDVFVNDTFGSIDTLGRPATARMAGGC